MKLFLLTAIIAVVASSPLLEEQKWPWKVGKVYRYEVDSHTWTKFEEGITNGNVFKSQFIVSVTAPGQLLAKLENPLYAPVKANLVDNKDLPSDLKYQPIQNIDEPFEIVVDGGRVVSINLASTISVAYENLLKGLISALQVDLSTYGHIHDYPNVYDKESFQGQFKKMEADVTGDCETLHTVSPMSAEWRRELPNFDFEDEKEDPIEIVKSKNYGNCQKRVHYQSGVPNDSMWKSTTYGAEEKQFFTHTFDARTLVSKQGTIYKSEVMSTVFASPLIVGKQKAEVYSYVKFYLKSVEADNSAAWKKPKEYRTVNSLLFTLDPKLRPFTNVGEQNVAKAQQLLQDMTPLLQNPNNIPKGEFLVKFNILVSILASMDSKQLNQMTASVDVARNSKNVAKNGMWIIYRDAVAQTGTTVAFEQIKSWVLTKKVEGEEAAEVITGIGSTIANPSLELLTDFFNFATSPVVTDLKYVNNSALLAVSKLFRFSEQDQFIVDTVIPHFSKELKHAIENGESSKAQVYVIVLGNLAHPDILKVFAPYLEGQITVTKYLRTLMVTNLKTLANLKNKYVRAVLYSILRNTAEPYEVRVAAALNIFMAFPTPEMMQVMAHMTNDDPSTQVRAVLANSITIAAGLKGPHFAELALTAKSVMHRVTKVKYGYRYSTDSLVAGYTDDDEFSFFRELAYIGSENNILPKYQRTAMKFKHTGILDGSRVTLSVSDMQDIVEYLATKIYEPTEIKTDFKFSAKQIIEMLNIKRAARQPLEAAVFVENMNQQRLTTFGEEEFDTFVDSIMNSIEQIVNGVEVQYTKILKLKQVYVAFPLASGMPFKFQYSEPMIFMSQAQSKVALAKGNKSGSLENKIDITYSRNIDGAVGYVDTIGEVFAAAGVINKLQFYVPIKMDITFKSGNFKMTFEPLHADKDINFIHMSVWPYTGTQKKDVGTFEKEVIKRPIKTITSDFKIGYWSGLLCHIQGYSYSFDYETFHGMTHADMLTNIGNLLYQKDIALTVYNFKYLAKESKTKSVTFTFYYDTLYNQKNSGEMGPATMTEHTEPNSVPRREELAKKVSSGIDSAVVRIIDITAEFNGDKKIEYLFTGAYAYSFVDPKFQAGFFARGDEQVNAVFKLDTKNTKIVPLNFEEALKNDVNISYEAEIKNQHNMSFHMKGFGKRTEDYTDLLRNDPKAKRCIKDVSHQNFYQKDCHRMIIKAHAPDYFEATVIYKNVNADQWTAIDVSYMLLKDYYSLNELRNPAMKVNDSVIEVSAQMNYYQNSFDYRFISKYGLAVLKDVEGLPHFPYAMAIYKPITPWERARNYYTDYQNLPYCAVDDNKVKTFSGRSYDYNVTSSWHVVMVDESNKFGKFDDLVILARRPSASQEEVYVSYKGENNKYIELEIKPNSVVVKSNGEKTCEGALTMYWDDIEDVPLLEYYTLAEGIQVFNILDRSLRLIYDNHRLVIFTDDHRSTTRGICGQSSTEPRDDYMTPWGLVNGPEYFGASYSLEGEFSDPTTVALKEAAKRLAYQPVTKYTKILRSDADWANAMNKTS